MSARIRCPKCQAVLNLPDTVRGKMIRCPKCQQALRVPAAKSPDKPEQLDELDVVPTDSAEKAQPLTEQVTAAAARPAPALEVEPIGTPRAPAKKSRGPLLVVLLLVGIGAVGLLGLGCVGVAGWFLWPKSPAEAPRDQVAAADQPADDAPRDRRKAQDERGALTEDDKPVPKAGRPGQGGPKDEAPEDGAPKAGRPEGAPKDDAPEKAPPRADAPGKARPPDEAPDKSGQSDEPRKPPQRVGRPGKAPDLGLMIGQVLPKKAVAGKPFKYQLPADEGQTFQLLRGPEGMTVSPEGKISWTPGPGPGRSEAVSITANPGGPLFFKIAVEEDPAATLALSKPAGWVLLPDGVTLIVALPEQGKLAYIDTLANKEIKRVDLPFKPGPLAFQGKLLFAGVQGAAVLHVLDLDSGEVKKEIKVPEGPVTDLTCHREKGLVYAATTTQRIVVIDPAAGTATASKARGMFLAVEPVKGDVLYSGIQPEIKDVLIINELSGGRIALSPAVRGEQALLAKLTINGKQLRVVNANPNAASNGYLVRVSPDGTRVAVVGGGGYLPDAGPAGLGKRRYEVALFGNSDIKVSVGTIQVGAHPHDLAFHPVLDLGVAQQVSPANVPQAGLGNALHLFNSKSLVRITSIPLSAGSPPQPALPLRDPARLLTFAAKGTKLFYYDGAGQGALRSIELPLSDKDREALQAAYGKE